MKFTLNNSILPMTALALCAEADICWAGNNAKDKNIEAGRPNIVIIMTDQQRADLSARYGYELNLTPFADSVARTGCWFDKAYTPCPASAPARVSMLTGRFPKATHVDSNHNIQDAVFSADLFSVAAENGYKTALVGKNHTYMTAASADFWCPYDHLGKGGRKDTMTVANREFDEFLGRTDFYASFEPSPGTVKQQIPYRMVSDALNWIGDNKENPFVMFLSFPEPHNPYQVCEPYFSMFDGKVPAAATDSSALAVKGEKFVQLRDMMKMGHKGYDVNLERIRTTYMGMVRMLDDQMRRFVEGVREQGIYDNTVFLIIADHGDYVGEYGLMKKGAGMVDAIMRVPMVWFGHDIAAASLRDEHVSLVDIFPTLCEIMGTEIPYGVQGRSLKQVIEDKNYCSAEFESIFAEAGFGGQYITKEDVDDYVAEGAVGKDNNFFDELNSWSQSGRLCMVRKGDWKLVYDMLGKGELYNLSKDPSEMNNLFGKKRYAKVQNEMLSELLKWEIATVDPLPLPRKRYHFKRNPHNYLFEAEELVPVRI